MARSASLAEGARGSRAPPRPDASSRPARRIGTDRALGGPYESEELHRGPGASPGRPRRVARCWRSTRPGSGEAWLASPTPARRPASVSRQAVGMLTASMRRIERIAASRPARESQLIPLRRTSRASSSSPRPSSARPAARSTGSSRTEAISRARTGASRTPSAWSAEKRTSWFSSSRAGQTAAKCPESRPHPRSHRATSAAAARTLAIRDRAGASGWQGSGGARIPDPRQHVDHELPDVRRRRLSAGADQVGHDARAAAASSASTAALRRPGFSPSASAHTSRVAVDLLWVGRRGDQALHRGLPDPPARDRRAARSTPRDGLLRGQRVAPAPRPAGGPPRPELIEVRAARSGVRARRISSAHGSDSQLRDARRGSSSREEVPGPRARECPERVRSKSVRALRCISGVHRPERRHLSSQRLRSNFSWL